MCVFVANIARNSVVFQTPNKQFFSSERSTQQANSYTKQVLTNRIPVTAAIIRVNEASDWNSSTKHLEFSGMDKCGKLNESLA